MNRKRPASDSTGGPRRKIRKGSAAARLILTMPTMPTMPTTSTPPTRLFSVPVGYRLLIDNIEITINALQAMSTESLVQVTNLCIDRPEYGKITWLEPVDLSGGMSFMDIFIFTDTVDVGHTINKRVRIEMYRLAPRNTPPSLVDYIEALKVRCIENVRDVKIQYCI